LNIAGSGSKPATQMKQDIVPLLYSIAKNTTITALDISGNGMGNSGAIALGKALQINHTLTSIKWDENSTGLLGFINVGARGKCLLQILIV
jgi:hypothetical protein